MLVPLAEVDQEITNLWQHISPAGSRLVGMTAFGDLLLETTGAILLLRLSWFVIEEIGTVMEEVEWQLESPAERGADWAYPTLQTRLPTRPAGFVYHFVQPLGLGGELAPSNVTLLSIANTHRGMRELWSQVADLPAGPLDGRHGSQE